MWNDGYIKIKIGKVIKVSMVLVFYMLYWKEMFVVVKIEKLKYGNLWINCKKIMVF